MKLQISNLRTNERTVVDGEDQHVEAKLRLMFPGATGRVPDGHLGNVIHAVARLQDVGLVPLEGSLPAPVRALPDDVQKSEPAPPQGPTSVWRVEDDAGFGPYHKTNYRRIGATGIFGHWEETQKTPGVEGDFSPEHIKDYYGGALRSGFSAPEHAEQWFTKEGLSALAQHGLTLRQRAAEQVVPGKSGLQVLFRPAMQKSEPLLGPDGGTLEKAVRDLTQHPGFQRWFAGSHAVGPDGKPLRLFHGTQESFTKFSAAKTGLATGSKYPGGAFFFTDSPEVASDYAQQRDWEPGRVMSVHLSVKNPHIVDAQGKGYGGITREAIEHARRHGHDGAIIRNVIDAAKMRSAKPSTIYVAFHPHQVKSVFAAEFDPASPHVGKSEPDAGGGTLEKMAPRAASPYRWSTSGLHYSGTPLAEPSPENIKLASDFVLAKWKDRAREYRAPEPTDLKDACKFSACFAQHVFGGVHRGNWNHEFVQHPTAGVIDLTGGVPPSRIREPFEPHQHDRFHFGNSEHKAIWQENLPRVQQWVDEFRKQGPVGGTLEKMAPRIPVPLGIHRAVDLSNRFGQWHQKKHGEWVPDCQHAATVVGAALHRLGHQVKVVGGTALGDDDAGKAGSHYWLNVDGKHFDPKSHIVGVPYTDYNQTHEWTPEQAMQESVEDPDEPLAHLLGTKKPSAKR